MDLHRHIRLLWRSKLLILAGAAVGILLGILASYKVSGSGLEVRKLPLYTTQSKLMVTQNGFPWGRATLPGSAPSTIESDKQEAQGAPTSQEASINFADPGRLATLAWMYSHFLMGDQVKSMVKNAPEDMMIDAAPLTAGGNMSASALPLIGLTITTHDAAEAQRLSREVPDALERYLAKEQSASKTDAGDRVEITVVNKSQGPIAGKNKAMLMSLVVFMMALAAAVALAYILENLRHSSRRVETLAERRDHGGEPSKPTNVHPHSPPHVRETGSEGGWASGPPAPSSRFGTGSR